jgi:hypothetical protein
VSADTLRPLTPPLVPPLTVLVGWLCACFFGLAIVAGASASESASVDAVSAAPRECLIVVLLAAGRR